MSEKFHAVTQKAFCETCKTEFFTHYERRIKNKICVVCEKTSETGKIVRSWN